MNLRIITEDFPVIHINGSSIDGKLEAHRTNEVLDHPDGSVTWDKLSDDVKDTFSTVKNLTDGEADGSLKSKNASGALSKDSVALGDGCVAGSKCFNITAFDDTNKSYTLDSVEGLEVGDVFYLKLQRNFDNFGKITAINGNVVTVDNYQPDEASDVKYFRVPEKPTCGTTDFGVNAFSGGEECIAAGDNSYTEGKKNRSNGRYAHTEGKETQADYAGHAEGAYTHAGGEYCHTEGYKTKATQKTGHAEGSHTIVDADYGHAEGKHTVVKSPCQHVQGKLNILDEDGKFAHIVGNGSESTGKRSNAHTVDWDGNAWYAGDVKSEKYGALSEKLDETVAKTLLDAKIGNDCIGTYCLRNLVAGITAQLYVSIAYPIPGVSKYVLVVNGKLMCNRISIGNPIKIASALSNTTKSYLCFLDDADTPLFYACFNENIKAPDFTVGTLVYTNPLNPWVPDEDFE